MKIVVCVKQAVSGELNPFDACAYETALRIPDSEVVLLSMGPERTGDMLLNLTRLGAKEAYHLCDKAFAGSDTLATAYILSLALKKLQPDLVICGRQTMDGDTAQTGPGLSILAEMHLITNVMQVVETEGKLTCVTRDGDVQTVSYPALITVERIHNLRLPSIRSKKGTVAQWSAGDMDADLSRCGFKGSPTKVVSSFQNEEGTRKCKYIEPSQLMEAIESGLAKEKDKLKPVQKSEKRLRKVWMVGEAPRSYAESISDDITVIDKEMFFGDAESTKVPYITGVSDALEKMAGENSARIFAQHFAAYVKKQQPEVILWGSDSWSKAVAPQVAALLQTGLCADCTALETDGNVLYMYRPAFSGNIIAKITCSTKPAMATVRTLEKEGADILLSVGKGCKDVLPRLEQYVEDQNALWNQRGIKWDFAASRGAVDAELMPYHRQVGITGKSMNPPVYIAAGISGAVHHIVGMKQSGTVIAINNDPKAPIFDYADYGIVAPVEQVL